MAATFSILIGTLGRPSLERTLNSIAAQALCAGDEVLVIADGPSFNAQRMFEASHLPGRYLYTSPTRNWGHSQRNFGMAMARGTYFLAIDDDDWYLPGAFDAIRRVVTPCALHLFRIEYGKEVLPRRRVIEKGEVSTQMVCAPNLMGRLGWWGTQYSGDFDFIAGCAALHDQVCWHDDIIAVYGRLATEGTCVDPSQT